MNDLPAHLLQSAEGNATDYLWLTRDSNHLIEFAAGHLEFLPRPSDDHQVALINLLVAFRAALAPRGGVVLCAPLRLRLAADRFREPDLLLLLDAKDVRRGQDFWTGADLVVEVLSPSNREHDLVTKRTEYAAAGILEYWIADPEARTLTALSLEAGTYAEQGRFGPGQSARSRLLTDLLVEVALVFG